MTLQRFIPLVAMLSLAGPSSAQASGAPTEREAAVAASVLLSSTIVAPITVVGAVIYGVFTTTRSGGGSDVAAEAFLRENATQLAVDLTTGDGPVLRDLASAAEIDETHYALFSQRMRSDRRTLLELADVSLLTPERARLFLTHVGNLIKSDETLARNHRAYLERHEHEG